MRFFMKDIYLNLNTFGLINVSVDPVCALKCLLVQLQETVIICRINKLFINRLVIKQATFLRTSMNTTNTEGVLKTDYLFTKI